MSEVPDEDPRNVDGDVNPYQAPAAKLGRPRRRETRRGRRPRLAYASTGKRFGTYIIDSILMILLMVGLGMVVGYAAADTVVPAFLDQIPGLVFSILMALVYYLPQELLFHRTVGKLIFGTKVVKADGSAPSFGQIVGRTLCRNIPFEQFSFLGGGSSGWHDSISNTCVIDASSASNDQ